MKSILGRAGLQCLAGVFAIAAQFGAAQAQELSPALQKKVDGYVQKLAGWAADPAVVAAARAANEKSGSVTMTNSKWEELTATDPAVVAYLDGSVSKKLKQWESDSGINKLFLRDTKGNFVAGSAKPLLFNVATRPPFKAASEGKSWSDSKVRADPSSQLKSVQISVPVVDGGKPIAVLHSAVTAE